MQCGSSREMTNVRNVLLKMDAFQHCSVEDLSNVRPEAKAIFN